MDEAPSLLTGDTSIVQPDDAVLDRLIRQYGALIRHAIRRASRGAASAMADDIEQTVVINLWQQIRREQTIDHPASYLYKAAVRETVRAVRRERVRREAAEAVAGPPASRSSDPEHLTAARERREALASALAALAPDRARVVRAHLAGFSVQEIMTMTGWPYQRARNLIARGMADLRASLDAKGMR